MSINIITICIAVAWLGKAAAVYDWSFQQRLLVPEAGETFGITPPALFGRGFLTLITGFDASSSSPGVFVHTTDEGYVRNGQYVWSQQAKLLPRDIQPGDGFGSYMLATNNTLLISSPAAELSRGVIYVFNGTLRHWSQIQRLSSPEPQVNERFGEKMSLYQNKLLIGAKGTNRQLVTSGGSVYVYARPSTGIYWSRQGKLFPRDTMTNQFFGESLSMYDNLAVISARNDDADVDTGSAYIFQETNSLWSQQQKLIALDMQNYRLGVQLDKLDLTLGRRYLGPSLAITPSGHVAVGVINEEPGKINKDSIYVFAMGASTKRWSLQQKLFGPNDTTPEFVYHTQVYAAPLYPRFPSTMPNSHTIYTTVRGPNVSTTYIYKSLGNSWSLQSKLVSYNETTGQGAGSGAGYVRPHITNFTNPVQWAGTLFHQAGREVQMRTPYHNKSCLILWMSDHFGDGWDTAVLTVRAPDLTNDTFHPHCDQVNPFIVRYCPYSPEDEGVYIIKVFAATKARFFWEISWQVYVESTGIWYRGDFATKMLFSFSKETMAFSLVATENVISDSTASTSNSIEDILGPRCERCTTVAKRSWEELQVTGNSAFWPLVVFGAPYYISDYAGRNLFSMGKVCQGVATFECYQTLVDGVYTLRLGQGLFGPLTKFPYANASWTGCDAQGGDRQQFIFRIRDGRCVPLQTHTYLTRCDRPDAVNTQIAVAGEVVPTHGGTVAPTQSVYGDPYVKGQMYVHSGKGAKKEDKDKRDADVGGNKYHIDNMPDHMYIV